MSKKIYFVTFDIERRREKETYHYIFHCMAANAGEAKEKAREEWIAKGNKRHQFHMYGKKSNIQDPALLKVNAWTGKEIKGDALMDNSICWSITSWRKGW